MSTTDIKIDVVFTSECIKHFSVLKAQGFNLKGNEKGLIGYIIKQILHVHFFLISDLSAPGNICLFAYFYLPGWRHAGFPAIKESRKLRVLDEWFFENTYPLKASFSNSHRSKKTVFREKDKNKTMFGACENKTCIPIDNFMSWI